MVGENGRVSENVPSNTVVFRCCWSIPERGEANERASSLRIEYDPQMRSGRLSTRWREPVATRSLKPALQSRGASGRDTEAAVRRGHVVRHGKMAADPVHA